MKNQQSRKDIFFFLSGTTLLTWVCIWAMARLDGPAHPTLFTILDFLENASPLLMALLLLRASPLPKEGIVSFLLGEPFRLRPCLLVAALFLLQYLNFSLFSTGPLPPSFPQTLIAQCLLGGGLEEAGWRGWLLPALRRKFPILPASILVSLIWVGWHLPYFFIGSSQTASFTAYLWIGILTGLCLTAIHVLTKSVLLCTVFHSFQNALVLSFDVDMGNPLFQILFLMLGLISAVVCVISTANPLQKRPLR